MHLPVGELLLFAFGGNALFLGGWAAASRALGFGLRQLTLGMGPAVYAGHVGATRVELRPLPMVSSAEPAEDFWAQHPLARAGVMVGVWLPVAAVAVALLGPAGALHSIGSAYGQIWSGVVSPPAGTALLERFFQLPTATAAGVFAAKLVAFNWLPWPSVAGGAALGELVRWKRERKEPGRVAVGLLMLSMLGLLPVTVQWLRALWGAL
jgi:hypothetical protein